MLELAINALFRFLDNTKPMKISVGKSIEALNCRIVEIQEQQNFGLPNSPVDDGTYRGDTIYKMPLTLNIRVYVKADDIDGFLAGINAGQFGEEMFSVHSLYNKVYQNMKILSYSRDTNAAMVGAAHYNIQMQELIPVKALVENYKNAKKAGYSGKKDVGNKAPQEKPKSALFSASKSLGAF